MKSITPLRVQLVVETTNGSGKYHSEAFTSNPNEMKCRPFYLYELEESNRLLAIKSSEAFNQTIKGWHELAKQKPMKIEN